MKGTLGKITAFAALLCAPAASAQDVTFWNVGEAIVNDFTDYIVETYPGNASIDAKIYPNQAYKTALQVAIGADNQADVFFNWGGERTYRFIRTGRLRDLTDAAAAAGIPTPLLSPYSTDGERFYGMPLTQHTVAFFYNSEVFDRLGLDEPKTLDDFNRACRAIHDEGEVFPISFGAKEPWTAMHYLTMLFTRFVPADVRAADDALEGDNLYSHPGYADAFGAFRDMQDAKCFNRGINSVNPEEARSFFAAEISAMTFCGTWCLAPVDEDGMAGRYGLFPMPAAPGAAGDQEAVFVVPEGFNISAGVEDPEAAEALLAHIYSTDVQAEMVRLLGRLPVNAEALDRVETTGQFAEAVRLTASAPSTVMAIDMSMDAAVAQELERSAQEFLNRTKSAEEVMAGVSRAADRTKARRTRAGSAQGN